jgi:hypothetical protein
MKRALRDEQVTGYSRRKQGQFASEVVVTNVPCESWNTLRTLKEMLRVWVEDGYLSEIVRVKLGADIKSPSTKCRLFIAMADRYRGESEVREPHEWLARELHDMVIGLCQLKSFVSQRSDQTRMCYATTYD